MSDNDSSSPADEINRAPFRLYQRRELPEAIHALHATDHGIVGGCLHVVLDDLNIEAHHVAWCANHAARMGCPGECFNIALSLLALPTDDDRDWAVNANA